MESELSLLLLFLVHCIIIKRGLIHGVTAFDITSFQSIQLCPGNCMFLFLMEKCFCPPSYTLVVLCQETIDRLSRFDILHLFLWYGQRLLAAWLCVKKHAHVHRFFVLLVLLTMLGLMLGTHRPCTVPLSLYQPQYQCSQ